MLRRLLVLYVLTAPFTAWFAYTMQLRLPVMVLIVITGLAVPIVAIRLGRFAALLVRDKEDLLLVIFLYLVWISYLFGFGSRRSFNHAMSYTFAIGIYLMLPKSLFRYYRMDSNRVSRYIGWSAYLCCMIIVLETISVNVLGIEPRRWFLRDSLETRFVSYYYLHGVVFPYTVPGVSDEPGVMGLILNIICPIGIWHYLRNGKRAKARLLTLLYLVSMAFVQSTAALVFGGLAFALATLMHLKYRIHLATFVRLALLTLLSIPVALSIPEIRTRVVEFGKVIIPRLTLNANLSGSANQRLTVWSAGLENWAQSPLVGHGPGYGVETLVSGYISVPITLLADIGTGGFLLFYLAMLVILVKILLLAPTPRFFLLVAFLSTMGHLLLVADYYMAPPWLMILLVQLAYEEKHRRLIVGRSYQPETNMTGISSAPTIGAST